MYIGTNYVIIAQVDATILWIKKQTNQENKGTARNKGGCLYLQIY